MAHLFDYLLDLVRHSWVEVVQSAANSVGTVTRSAEAQRHHVVTKVDASFSASTSSAELTVSYNSVVIARKDIHGAGALDFGILGFENATVNTAVAASLAAGGAGVTGDVTMTGYTTGPRQ